ncbi:hypothetical protein JTB14_018004 [Gonioctena quinquepunctata]|nr:hypothetical protein JTB14_018004 [Gonioctena quinquepunctata]
MKKYDERGLVEILQEFSSFQLYRNFFRVHENKNIFCMDLSQQLMPDIATMIQYELKDPNENFLSIYHSQKIFDEMKEILSNSLENSTLDDSSKEAFQEKLSDLKLGLITSGNTENTWDGYKDVFKDDIFTREDQIIGSFIIDPFRESTLQLTKDFLLQQFVVLHPVLFDRIRSGNPEYFEVAKLGLLLAQEIAKHFDPSGRLYRSDDSLSNDAFYNTLMERTHNLLITYYLKSDYSFHGRNLRLEPTNGTIMLNELIADNTAPVTLDPKYFDVEQIVFIAAAQEFCGKYSAVGFARDLFEGRQLPFPIKIQNMISNSESFSMAFECPEGSSMTLPS